jgi:signal peptidase II
MLYAIVVVLVLIADQAVKYWTILNIAPQGDAVPFISGVVELVNVHNTGAAFGIIENGRWFFIVLTVLAAAAIIYVLSKNIVKAGLGRWSLVFILAGGLGNFIDRLVNGYVVDMFKLQFMEFAVFNVADIFISVFGVIFCIFLIFHKEEEKEQPTEPSRPLPRATERPKQGVDYLTQLQKPVVEGLQAIEHEKLTREKAVPSDLDESFSAWNIPEPEGGGTRLQPAPKAAKRPEAPAPRDFIIGADKAEEKPLAKQPPSSPTSFAADALGVKPGASPKKNDADFSLEDIIAEFKD